MPWNNLFIKQNEAFKTSPFHQDVFLNEAQKNLTFSPFICNGEKVTKIYSDNIERNIGFNNKEINNTSKEIRNTGHEKRRCKSCKKDITHQRPHSLFCSAKYVGIKEAKKCRNKISNRKKDIKKKILKASLGNKYIAVTYKNKNLIYTDILHPEDFEFNEWFDKILKIEIR